MNVVREGQSVHRTWLDRAAGRGSRAGRVGDMQWFVAVAVGQPDPGQHAPTERRTTCRRVLLANPCFDQFGGRKGAESAGRSTAVAHEPLQLR